jgi:hypothetical protein
MQRIRVVSGKRVNIIGAVDILTEILRKGRETKQNAVLLPNCLSLKPYGYFRPEVCRRAGRWRLEAGRAGS